MKGGPGKGNARKERVAHNIRDALTEMIAADVRDPRVHAPTMLTVARVEMNVDMSVARCYVSIVGDDATADAALEGLAKAASYLRGPLGRRLGLQHAPELRFFLDPSIDVSAKLAAILREDEEKARAAGREPTPAVGPPAPAAAPPATPDDDEQDEAATADTTKDDVGEDRDKGGES